MNIFVECESPIIMHDKVLKVLITKVISIVLDGCQGIRIGVVYYI